ncbi:M48 family metallopeptidase [Sinorhizobium medicae]|uniref:M48 metallopeptidase family protein n=1 Tax=Sinorhizobium medicae TaxID=110321 RepID=UPI000C7A892B|nr:M48 family metallopeptidase [Sinorhizobium medicae]PLU02977.1 metal-dependent hydrolase [Sinorhizobium medicae]PLU57729.1 metal-dependent hydrolase [Sinorhizobium medicae]PLU72547.1 metal-dependent hydrolase [Sinorhizobium medicae]PLU82002.1 metal-dependent hydrolase [Sinorhizobium medicae]
MPNYLSDQDALKQRVARWAIKLKVNPRLVRIQRMTRKWGSCSSTGTITLAADLLDESDSFQDFVVAHELLHLRVPNHGRLFKALMTAHVPGWRHCEISRRRKRNFSSLERSLK